MVRFSRAQSTNTRFITWPESILFLYVTRLTFYYEILDRTSGGANTIFPACGFLSLKRSNFIVRYPGNSQFVIIYRPN